jgi:hypothetical protein
MKFSAVVFAAATLLVSGLSGPAMASKQVFPGSVCENNYPPDSSLGTGVYRTYGTSRNSSSSWRYMWCPIDRANGSNSSGATDLEVSVYDPTGEMWCQATSYNRYGNSTAVTEMRSVNSAGHRIIDFGSLPGGYYEGYYAVFCVVPSNGRISSITVDEP